MKYFKITSGALSSEEYQEFIATGGDGRTALGSAWVFFGSLLLCVVCNPFIFGWNMAMKFIKKSLM